LRLIGPAGPNDSAFLQKYIVLKRDRFRDLLKQYGLAVYKESMSDEALDRLMSILDGVMKLQGSHYFVVNLDERAGQEAMIAYWAAHGYARDEVQTCISQKLKGEKGDEESEKA
jgi:hypothetical protein